jgi:hypothetical protein
MVQGGTAMGESRRSQQAGNERRLRVSLPARRPTAVVIAAVAITDIAYRLLMREPLRRSLGIEPRHA